MNSWSRHWQIAKLALAEDRERAKGLLKSSEVEFLPAALEIVDKPVAPAGRITAYVLGAGLVVTLLWLIFGKVDVVASAPGKLIPVDNVKLVQPAEAGVVRAILVRNGQHVKKGQSLVELDPTVSTADVTQAQKALQTALLDAARGRAILSALDGDGLAFVAPDGTPPDIARLQRDLAEAQLTTIQAGAATDNADRQAAAASRDEARTQAAKLNETIPLLDEQLAANEALLARGYVAKLKVIEMRRQRMSIVRDRDIALQTARKADALMARSGSEMRLGVAEARAKVIDELSKAETEVNLRREELVKSDRRSRLQRLVAPVSGTVTQLAVHTVGGVVEAAKPIMVIVPDGGSLVAEVKLLNKDAGFVQEGQDAAVKLEAFPFTRYGTIGGRVVEISSDAVEDEKLGLIYTARVSLEKSHLIKGDNGVPLTPGMAATADIRTGRRTILSYLLSPIDEVRLEAGRER